ncbi:sulfite transporter TauE/SafE [Bacillus pseudomycoides]|uniref:Probable membrane transporter protein n=1 Tax=Bacillus pseudomycoides TaxID=64104 RepID=A0AA91VAB5_9BACI|nr:MULTISPECIES: sulfite exporter TauE/SafE family protein [Bacillus]PEB54463.1 sulfite transporter TauE/SafE [Bacillus sp. AFS098217]PED81427.1 sulfite transporter TauE/SafE [Bacillus pseudomycoides]PEU06682.1 sulfite transporter TauE/SafE [Bacillus sp. AFS019443]PEU19134.1 sulfite transporter TauE/SafE [Bacillus sp. AFS014408]PFW63243.1 sulfite transporter TauE/SafE [Bacillus sp. AFS075034]
MDTLFFTLLVIGIVSAFIGTLAGGGGLITLPAMMLVGVPIQIGIATNKFSSGIAALTSIFYLLKNKHLSVKIIIVNVCIAIIGGMSGALITSHVTEQTMNIMALILLIFALIITLKNKQWVSSVEGKAKDTTIVSNAMPFFIAAYDGGFGPGSSTFGILHYMNQKNTYMKAVQLTRVLIFGSCCGAFIIFYQTGFVQWNYAIAMAIGSAIGSQIGLIALPKIPLKIAKKLLITIIFLLIGQVAFKMI